VATAAQWQRGPPALDASVKPGTRVTDRIGRADPRVAGLSSTASTFRSISSASIRSLIHDPSTASALVHGAGWTSTSRKSLSLNSKEVMCNRTRRRPFQGPLVCTGRIPNRGELVLPATRHFQVEREWCPVTLASMRTWLAKAFQVVRNTYQCVESP
jgi:hypothetical protein